MDSLIEETIKESITIIFANRIKGLRVLIHKLELRDFIEIEEENIDFREYGNCFLNKYTIKDDVDDEI